MLGLVAALYDYDWQEAARRFELAMAGDPVPSQVRRHYALYYLLPDGQIRRGRGGMHRRAPGRSTQPDGPGATGAMSAGRRSYRRCVKELRHALELDEGCGSSTSCWASNTCVTVIYAEASQSCRASVCAGAVEPVRQRTTRGGVRIAGDKRRSEGLVRTLKAGPDLANRARRSRIPSGMFGNRRLRGLDRTGDCRAASGDLLLPACTRARASWQFSVARAGEDAESTGLGVVEESIAIPQCRRSITRDAYTPSAIFWPPPGTR